MAVNPLSAIDPNETAPGPEPMTPTPISPYLLMQAQKEAASGKPMPGGPVDQLGHAAHRMAQSLPALGPTQASLPQAAPPQMGPSPSATANPQFGWPAPASPAPPPPLDPSLQRGVNDVEAMKGAGLKSPTFSNEEDLRNELKNTFTQKTGAAPGAYAKSLQDVMSSTPFLEQRGALQKLQELAQARAAQGTPLRPTDLSGLMSAADFLNKTDTFGKDYAGQRASAAQAGQEAEKKGEQDFQNEATATKDQNDLYKEAQSGALGVLGGGSVGSVGNYLQAQKLMEGSGKGNSLQEFNTWKGGLDKDQILNAALKANDSFQTAKNLVNQNTNISALLAKGDVLRAMYGRVNGYEYQAAGGDTGVENTVNRLVDKLNVFQKNNPNVDPAKAFTPLDQQEFKQAVNSLAGQAQQTIQSRLGYHRAAAQSMNVDSSQVEPLLNTLAPPPAPAPAVHAAPVHNHAAAAPTPEAVAYAQKYNISPAQAMKIGQQKGWIK